MGLHLARIKMAVYSSSQLLVSDFSTHHWFDKEWQPGKIELLK
jgi:hypothetical protein